MATITIPEAKADFDALIDRVERGEDVTITRGGRMVARLTAVDTALEPVSPVGRIAANRQAIADRLRAEGQKPITAEEIVEWVHEGRR